MPEEEFWCQTTRRGTMVPEKDFSCQRRNFEARKNYGASGVFLVSKEELFGRRKNLGAREGIIMPEVKI